MSLGEKRGEHEPNEGCVEQTHDVVEKGVGGSKLTTDQACVVLGEGAGSGGQPGERPNRPTTETGSGRPSVGDRKRQKDRQDIAMRIH